MSSDIPEKDQLARPKQLLHMGPKYFKYIFMDPSHQRASYAICFFFTITRLVSICLALLLLKSADNFMIITDVVQSASAFLQGLKSMIPMLFFKDELLWLLTESKRFWPTDKETKDVEHFYKTALRVLNGYKQLYFVTFCLYVPVPFIFNRLPFPIWIPPFPGAFHFLYIMQSLNLTFDSVLVWGSDTFFIGICFNIYGQFQILHNRLRNIGKVPNQNIEREIIDCTQHHDFLLAYAKVLIKMFSLGLVFQYFVTTYSLCIEMFVFNRRNAVGMITAGIYCCMLMSQLAIYCFPADLVTDASAQCADAIYDSPWYEHHRHLKYILINCMQRSQKRLVFTAGGLIVINKEAYTTIFKSVLSLNTLMKNMFE